MPKLREPNINISTSVPRDVWEFVLEQAQINQVDPTFYVCYLLCTLHERKRISIPESSRNRHQFLLYRKPIK